MEQLVEKMAVSVSDMLPAKVRETFFLRAFARLKIPMLSFVRPSVLEVSETRCVVKIPLTRRTKNHLNSMYFGALATGADAAGGLIAMRAIQDSGQKISLIFKDFHAEFLQRPEGDVHFICEQGAEIRELVQRTIASGQRENLPVHLTAIVPEKSQEPVAKFILTLSLKRR